MFQCNILKIQTITNNRVSGSYDSYFKINFSGIFDGIFRINNHSNYKMDIMHLLLGISFISFFKFLKQLSRTYSTKLL